MPVKRPSSALKATLKRKIDEGEIDCGEEIIPRKISKNVVAHGTLTAKETTVFGQKVSLKNIQEMLID